MASWLLLAIGGQFLFAVSTLIDKHLLVHSTHIGKPIVYTFFVAVLSGFVVILIPFGVSFPGGKVVVYSVMYGALFLLALFFLFSALRVARASDVSPAIGAVATIATLAPAYLLLDGDLTMSVLPAIALLVIGTALISHFHFSRKAALLVLASGCAFGISGFIYKYVSLDISFIDSFFWSRIMLVLAGCSILLVPQWRHLIFHGGKHSSGGSKTLFVTSKAIASAASLVMALAVTMGSVSVVGALSGLQFVFLLIFAYVFAEHMPEAKPGSKTHGHGGWQTGVSVVCIVGGLALLSIYHA